jgi:hypothetical protein
MHRRAWLALSVSGRLAPLLKSCVGLQIVHLSKQFDDLASHLPDAMPPQSEQLQAIVGLQEEAEAGRQLLLAELETAKTQLQHAHQLFGHLADDRLQIQDK